MIVVDVNTLAYLWISGEKTELAEKALMRDAHWVSPLLWRSEFRNLLAGYIRRGLIDREAAIRCVRGAESQMRGCEYRIPSEMVLNKVMESACSAYDCEYVALADDLGISLVTSDKQILTAFPKLAVSLEAFVE